MNRLWNERVIAKKGVVNLRRTNPGTAQEHINGVPRGFDKTKVLEATYENFQLTHNFSDTR